MPDYSVNYTHVQREKRIRHNIEALTDQQRADMAALILAGYKFMKGNIYWRCKAPDRLVQIAALDTLHACIETALAHHNKAVRE